MAQADAEAAKLRRELDAHVHGHQDGKTTVIGSGVLDAAALKAALR